METLYLGFSDQIVPWQVDIVDVRHDHYPVCRLDIRQDSEFATGYGYPETAIKREPDTDPDIRNAFFDISRIQIFWKKLHIA